MMRPIMRADVKDQIGVVKDKTITAERLIPIILIILIIIGLLLRLFKVGTHSFWGDEAISLVVLRYILGIDLTGEVGYQLARPFYYLLMIPFFKLSQSEVSLRMVSVLCGTLAIPLMYNFGSRLFNKTIGIIGALLITFSPFHIYYSQEIRSYGLLLLLSLLGFYYSLRALEDDRTVNYLLMVVSFVAGLYTHIFCFFSVLIMNVYILLTWKDNRIRLKKWFIANMIIFVLSLPVFYLTYYHATNYHHGLADFPSGIRSLIGTFYLFTMGRVYFPNGLNLFVIIIQSIIFGIGLLLGARQFRIDRKSKGGARSFSFAVASILVYAAIWVFSMLFFPLFDEARVNYLIFLLPIYFLVVSLGWGSLSKPVIKYTVIFIAILLNLISIYPFYFQWDQVGKGNFRAASSYIEEKYMEGDVVYHTNNSSTTPFDYYLNWRVPQIDLSVPDLNNSFEKNRFWLIVFKQQGGVEFTQKSINPNNFPSNSSRDTKARVCNNVISDNEYTLVVYKIFPGKNELTVCLYEKR